MAADRILPTFVVDVWMGMPHGFPSNIGRMKAAALALDDFGAFLMALLQAPTGR